MFTVAYFSAKMFLKQDLAWLDGYPIAQTDGRVTWQLRPQVGHDVPPEVVLDRERLSKAQFSFIKLVGRFPLALPKLVGNVAQWERRVNVLLSAAKSAVHQGVSLLDDDAIPLTSWRPHERQQVEDLSSAWPALQPVLRALMWSTCVDSEPRAAFLTWFSDNADWLSEMLETIGTTQGVRVALLLADLARDGDETLQSVKAVLRDPRASKLPAISLRQHLEYIQRIIAHARTQAEMPRAPEWPSDTWHSLILSSLSQFAAQGPAIRRRAFALLNEVLLPADIEPLATQWASFQADVVPALNSVVIERDEGRFAKEGLAFGDHGGCVHPG